VDARIAGTRGARGGEKLGIVLKIETRRAFAIGGLIRRVIERR
jgi:hypothetical protein